VRISFTNSTCFATQNLILRAEGETRKRWLKKSQVSQQAWKNEKKVYAQDLETLVAQ
jgi:hypothetical protein